MPKQFIVFMTEPWDCVGGWRDLLREGGGRPEHPYTETPASFDTIEDAVTAALSALGNFQPDTSFHVVDLHTLRVVKDSSEVT